jgi:uncharacterized membrane protein
LPAVEGLCAVTTYQVSVAVHVMVAIIVFGPTFVFPLIQITAERASPRHLPFAWEIIRKIDYGVVTPGVLLVFATGIYQWTDGVWDLGRDQWLSISLGLLVVLYALSFFIFHPAERNAIAASEAMINAAGPEGEVELSDEYRAATKIANIAGPIYAVSVLFIVYLMVVKPF